MTTKQRPRLTLVPKRTKRKPTTKRKKRTARKPKPATKLDGRAEDFFYRSLTDDDFYNDHTTELLAMSDEKSSLVQHLVDHYRKEEPKVRAILRLDGEAAARRWVHRLLDEDWRERDRYKALGRAQREERARAWQAYDAERRQEEADAEDAGPGKKRMTVHVPVEVINLCRDATVALSGPPVRLTLSALAETALRREVERLSKAHHGGKPFPPRVGELKGGRPIGAPDRG
jgi:hypothetical protein